MTFQPENRLEQSLLMAARDPAHRPQFYKDLAESDLFIIQRGPPPERGGTTVLRQGQRLEIEHMDFKGTAYISVFSSLTRLRKVLQEDSGYIALNALELMKVTRCAEMFLNPGSEFGKAFGREELQSILDGSIWRPSESYTAPRDTEVMIGQPSDYPYELAEALARIFSKGKEVKRAYLANFFNPERDERPHTLVAIEVSGDFERVVSLAGMVARNMKVPDPPVEFVQITGGGGVEDYFLNECQPFYKRKVLGLF